MNKQTLTLVSVLAIALLALALMGDNSGRSADAAATNESLFPELLAELNDARSIEISQGPDSLGLERSGDAWGLASKHAYPVKLEGVRKTLIGLARLAVLDAKTSKPDLYARLGVQEPGPDNAETRRITVRGADGLLADLIVGKRREGAGNASHYVRRVGQAESWLVSGDLDFSVDESTWLDKQILKVAGDRVQSVRVSHGDGEVLMVDKAEQGQQNYTVNGVPEGSTLRYETVANAMGTALNYLNFTDVLPASELVEDPAIEAETTFTCFDGMTIVVETFSQGDKPFARFRAAVSEAPSGNFDVPEAPAAEDPEGESATAPEPQRDLAGLEAEAASIQAKVSPWVYEISPYTRDIFARRMADLINASVPEEGAVEIPSPPGASPEAATLPQIDSEG
jgi:hypothetical protein